MSGSEKPGTDSEEWLRARTLWETRFCLIEKIVESEEQLTEYVMELNAFVRWVPLIPEDLENFYHTIRIAARVSGGGALNELIEFLSSVVVDHAHFTVSLLEELVTQASREPWFLMGGRTVEHVRSVLEAAMSSDDNQTKSCAVRVVNLFGERGNERYRDLLNPG